MSNEVLSGSELFKKLASNRGFGKDDWVQTTEEVFYEQMGTVPPAAVCDGGFAGGEPWDHDPDTGDAIHACFLFIPLDVDVMYIARYMTLKEFQVDATVKSTSHDVRWPHRDKPTMAPTKSYQYIVVNMSGRGRKKKFTKEDSCYMEPIAIRLGVCIDYRTKDRAEEKARYLNERNPDGRYAAQKVTE